MTRRALACGAAVGLVEAARALASLPHVTPRDGAVVTVLSTLACALVTAGVALALRPFVAARLARAAAASGARRDGFPLVVASGAACGVLIGTLRLRGLAGWVQPELLALASGPLLEGVAAGFAVGWLLTHAPARGIRAAWWAVAALGIGGAATASLREWAGERLAAPYAGRPRPNVLLVSVDTLRADRLGAYGGPLGLTPALDRLAAQGITFERATTPVPITGPAHTTLLTGLDPIRHGVVRNGVRLRDGVESVAETLTAAGYRTAGFVSAWPLTDASSGLAHHFQRYDEDLPASTGVPRAAEEVPLLWLADRGAMLAFGSRSRSHRYGHFLGEIHERDGARTVDRALSWIARRHDGPFFAFVHLYEPHTPYAPPMELARALGAGAEEALSRFDPGAPERPLEELFADPAAVARIRRLYDAEVAHADAAVGRLLAGLERLGRAGDTVVVLTADHGEGLGEHGEFFRHSDYLYETTLHVPLLVHRPTEPAAGRRIGALVGLADVAPTLLELAGVAVPETLDGRSLVSLFDGGEGPGGRVLHASIGGVTIERGVFGAVDLRHAVRDRRHKLIWSLDRRWPYRDGPAYEELYDLEADPAELVSLLPAAADPALVERLRDEMRRRLAQPAAAGGRLDPEIERRLRALGYL